MMTDMTLISAIALLALAALYLRHRQRHQQDSQRLQIARKALEGSGILLDLVRAIQQHRGLSSGWLAGERSFEQRLHERRREIDRHLNGLAEIARLETAMPRPCFTHQNLVLFRFQWRELVEDLPVLSIEQSIARHSLMISRALDWLSSLGEARIELAVPDKVTAGLVRNHADRLPMLAEYLGQVRAVGSGVAARQQCSPVARVRLRYLTTRAEMLLKEAHAAAQNAESNAAAKAVTELLGVVNRQLLGTGTIKLKADVYFETATRAIDAVYGWVEACGEAVAAQLAAEPAAAGLALAK